jgi:hypothetical protein
MRTACYAVLAALLALSLAGCKRGGEKPDDLLTDAARSRVEGGEASHDSAGAKAGSSKEAARGAKAGNADATAQADQTASGPADAKSAEAAGDGTAAEAPEAAKAEAEGGGAANQASRPTDATTLAEGNTLLVEAWGHRGKQRPSQRSVSSLRMQEAYAKAMGPSYARKPSDEVDKIRAREQDGPELDPDLFVVITDRTPFKRIYAPPYVPKPGLRGEASGEAGAELADAGTSASSAGVAGGQGAGAASGGSATTGGQTAASAPGGGGATAVSRAPVTTDVPPVTPYAGGVSGGLPGGAGGGIAVAGVGGASAARPEPARRRPQLGDDFSLRGVPFERASAGARGAVNLQVQGTVVGTGGPGTAILTDGTNTVTVQQGQSISSNGRQLRVVEVAHDHVVLQDGGGRVVVGMGGTGP